MTDLNRRTHDCSETISCSGRADPREYESSGTLPILYRKGLLCVAETWFQDATPPAGADIVRCVQIPAPIDGVSCDEFCTLMVDLTADCDAILAGMDRSTRYKIRRAETKDGLRYEHRPVRRFEDMREFLAAYDTHVVSRSDDLSINRAKITRLSESGQLDLSVTCDNQGIGLTRHVHILGAGTARLLYSVSEASRSADTERRNLCGRANRLHHWRDMQRFQSSGIGRYDFGGFYTGSTDAKRLKINEFKRGFGGQLAVTYNCVYPLTLRGRMALAAWRLLRRGER